MAVRRKWLIAFIVVLLPVLFVLARRVHGPVSLAKNSGFGPVGPPDRPFAAGKRVTLAQAKAEAGFPIRLPEDPLANSRSLTTVWHENDGPEMDHVALEFSTGIEIILEPTGDAVRPYGYLTEAAEAGPPAAIVPIHGVPAMVLPANADFTDGGWTEADAIVTVDFEGVNYLIAGAYPTDDLVRIAESLEPT